MDKIIHHRVVREFGGEYANLRKLEKLLRAVFERLDKDKARVDELQTDLDHETAARRRDEADHEFFVKEVLKAKLEAEKATEARVLVLEQERDSHQRVCILEMEKLRAAEAEVVRLKVLCDQAYTDIADGFLKNLDTKGGS